MFKTQFEEIHELHEVYLGEKWVHLACVSRRLRQIFNRVFFLYLEEGLANTVLRVLSKKKEFITLKFNNLSYFSYNFNINILLANAKGIERNILYVWYMVVSQNHKSIKWQSGTCKTFFSHIFYRYGISEFKKEIEREWQCLKIPTLHKITNL